jgi:hypothetical protein
MPTRVQLLEARDFKGGLNLRADAFQLAPNESPDMLNVDIDPRGGFALRKGVAPLNSTALSVSAHSMFEFHTAAGTQQILVGNTTKTLYGTGGNFTDCGTTWTSSTQQTAATFNDFLYIQNGIDAPRKWTGSAISTLGTTFNETLASPNDGDMPIAKLIAVHSGYVWVANTTESATSYKNRIRWSHPNRAEDWRTNDYIDVDIGHDGDQITALVPWADRLLIFKNKSVHVLTGYSPETFQVFALSQTTGTPTAYSVAVSEQGVYWFGWPDGVFFYDGKSIQWLFEKLHPAITDGTIPDDYAAKITLGWLRRRLYVCVPYGASETRNTHAFVYDPALGKGGAWMLHDLPLGPMLEWRRIGADALPLGLADTKVFKIAQDADTDDWDSVYSKTDNIESYYVTRWYDAGTASQLKRWKRPDIIMDGDLAVTIRVDVYRDYDPTNIKRSFEVSTESAASTLWGAFDWGEGDWATSSTAGSQEIKRGSSLGRARAVQLRFTGPAASVRWSVNSINFKNVPKRIR